MDFDYYNYFDRNENWGDPDRMSPLILSSIDIIRHLVGWPFVVHYGTQGEHSEGSTHYTGLAIDGHFVTDVPLYFQALRVMEKLHLVGLDKKMGIGLYPDWDSPGFHLDRREELARWGRIGLDYVSWISALDYTHHDAIEVK